jgi:RNA polymerase sigma-70 factor, ECF subfamily
MAPYPLEISSSNVTPSPLQRIAAGQPDAIRECIEEYGALVWSIARRLSRTPADAEDATQEIFLALWTHASRFDAAKGSDKVFIAMIARRRLIDRLRKAAHAPPMVSLDEIEEPCVDFFDDSVTSSMEEEHVAMAFASLRREHREVLELSLLDGLTQSAIAIRLGLPLGTVKSFMRRGLLALREFTNEAESRRAQSSSPQTLGTHRHKSSASRRIKAKETVSDDRLVGRPMGQLTLA